MYIYIYIYGWLHFLGDAGSAVLCLSPIRLTISLNMLRHLLEHFISQSALQCFLTTPLVQNRYLLTKLRLPDGVPDGFPHDDPGSPRVGDAHLLHAICSTSSMLLSFRLRKRVAHGLKH